MYLLMVHCVHMQEASVREGDQWKIRRGKPAILSGL